MSIKKSFYSMNSTLNWKSDSDPRLYLHNEVQLPGTLFSLQKWDIEGDRSGIICFKPLPGTCLVDLMRYVK